MQQEDIKTKISEWVPEASFDETGEWLNATVPPDLWKGLAKLLRETPGLDCDFLFCLTCIDRPPAAPGAKNVGEDPKLTMVYHLSSTTHRHNFVIKANLDRDKPEIDTVSDIWRTAEFLEREVYEMFGVQFLQHPDLRRLILTDDFEGWPLRKDFEDPINMIKL